MRASFQVSVVLILATVLVFGCGGGGAPTTPDFSDMKVVRTLEIPSGSLDIAVSKGYAYAVGAGFYIVDVDPPGAASIVKILEISGDHVAVSGGCAYVIYAGGDSPGLRIVDIDPPGEASVVKTVEIPGARDIAVSDGYAYIVGDDALYIITVEPCSDARVLKTLDLWEALHVAISDRHACVLAGGGLHIIDVDPPGSASVVKTVDIDGWNYSSCVAATRGYAYVGMGSLEVLHIIDVDPPAAASMVNSVGIVPKNSYDGVYCIAMSDGYAYTGGGDSLRIIDVEPYSGAREVASILIPCPWIEAVAVLDGYAYVAHEEGLSIIQLW